MPCAQSPSWGGAPLGFAKPFAAATVRPVLCVRACGMGICQAQGLFPVPDGQGRTRATTCRTETFCGEKEQAARELHQKGCRRRCSGIFCGARPDAKPKPDAAVRGNANGAVAQNKKLWGVRPAAPSRKAPTGVGGREHAHPFYEFRLSRPLSFSGPDARRAAEQHGAFSCRNGAAVFHFRRAACAGNALLSLRKDGFVPDLVCAAASMA